MTATATDLPRLLERGDELERLHDLVADAAAGHGGAVAVTGAAGIGKTSLLDAARARAAAAGLACLTARGGELERAYGFGVARQLFERPLRERSPGERAALMAGPAAAGAAALGARTAVSASADGAFGAVHGLYWLCAGLAERGPLLLVVDDVHWADAASLRFLAYLVRRVEDLPVAVLTAARPVAAAAQTVLLDGVVAAPEVVRLGPSPLSPAGVAALAEARLGPDGARVARECWSVTGGNPFLCRALLAVLADGGVPPAGADLAAAAAVAVSTVVTRRIGRLPPDADAVATAVAVLGTTAELRYVAALAGLAADRAAVAADALAGQGVLRAGRPLDFAHPLVRAAVREALPVARRALLHRRAAQVLDAAGAPVEEVAAQLLGAEPASDPWAVDRLRAAASAALAAGAPEAATAHLRRALQEPPDAPACAAVLRELGLAELQAGDPASGTAHLDEAVRRTAAPPERLAVLEDLATAWIVLGDYPGAVGALEEALALARAAGDPALGLEAQLLQVAILEPALRPRVESRIAVAADAPEDLPGRRDVLAALASHGAVIGAPAAEVREAARRAADAGIVEAAVSGPFAFNNVLYPLVCAEGFALADELTAAAVALTRRHSSVLGQARALGARAFLHLRRGDLREAIADGRAACEPAVAGRFYIAALLMSTLVRALTEHGELAAAEAGLARLDAGAGALPDRFLDNWLLESRAVLRAAQGRMEDALEDFTALRARHAERGQRNPALSAHRSGLALVLLRAGRAGEATVLVEEELALARAAGAPRAVAVALRALGLARGDLGPLEESAALLTGSPARLERARSLVELGAALRRAGRRADARGPLLEGLDVAARCAAEPLVTQAREELRAAGARPRRVLRTGVAALTPSELRVARLAARGLTNREIAQALFVTVRTVQVHLAGAFRKLGVDSRRDLRGIAGLDGVTSAQDVILALLADGPATTSQLYDRLGYPALLRLQLIDYRAFRQVIAQLEDDERIAGEPDEDGTIWRIR